MTPDTPWFLASAISSWAGVLLALIIWRYGL